MKRMFVDTPAGQIHCRTEGTGEPLLLLHQVACSSAEFSEIIPILAQHFRVLAMDMPLYGDSYKLTKEPEIADLAQATLDFLDALDINKSHIAGHHTGASVAVELAAEHPERVNKLVLSGCLSLSHEDSIAWLNNPKYKVLEVTPDGWFLQFIWDYIMERIPQDQMDKAYEYALDYVKAAPRVEEGHRAAFSYEILLKLEKITQPTLVLCGDKDVVFPHHEATLKHIPHAQSYVVKGGNAQTPRLLPREWAKVTLQFLRS